MPPLPDPPPPGYVRDWDGKIRLGTVKELREVGRLLARHRDIAREGSEQHPVRTFEKADVVQ